MSAMIERVYRVRDGKIQKYHEGDAHYDVDWGYRYDPDFGWMCVMIRRKTEKIWVIRKLM